MATTRRQPRTSAPARKSRSKGGSRGGGTTVLHTCGHKQKHKLPREPWKRERDVESLKKRVCTACWAEERAAEAEAFCGVDELPPISGTEKMVLWARSLRANALGRIRTEVTVLDRGLTLRGLKAASEQLLALALPRVFKKATARWWIDQRDDLESPLEVFLPPTGLKTLATIREALEQPVIECPF